MAWPVELPKYELYVAGGSFPPADGHLRPLFEEAHVFDAKTGERLD